jgi:hypothetical protein
MTADEIQNMPMTGAALTQEEFAAWIASRKEAAATLDMTADEIQNMPMTSAPLTQEEFAAWIASRKEAGAKIDVTTAELKGWWTSEGDPYGLYRWAPECTHESGDEQRPHYFVRNPQSRGWVWQGDLPDDKRAAMQARIDDHNRKVKEFTERCRAAGRLIDVNTCEQHWEWGDELDPYYMELAPYESINRICFVRNKDSDDWICIYDLPEEKVQALNERNERERLARKHAVEDIFNTLRRGGIGVAEAQRAIAQAETTYGDQIVKDALSEYEYPWGAIGGLLIQRGYLTMEHVAELLHGKPKGPPDIFRS